VALWLTRRENSQPDIKASALGTGKEFQVLAVAAPPSLDLPFSATENRFQASKHAALDRSGDPKWQLWAA
jgi:hypothetical protein